MKKIFSSALIIFGLVSFLNAHAGKSIDDKVYRNNDFNFSLRFPGEWNYDEAEKPKVKADVGFGISVDVGDAAGFGKMCNVNFAENPKVGKDSDEPNIDLIVMEYKPIMVREKSTKSESVKEKKSASKPECVIVENKSVIWGGQRAQLITQRCPEIKKVKIGKKKEKITAWRWITAVSMKRAKTNEVYNLKGEMLCTFAGDKLCDEVPDKGKAEFSRLLKPARDKMVATTQFIK